MTGLILSNKKKKGLSGLKQLTLKT